MSLKVQITVTELGCDKGGGERITLVKPPFGNLYHKWTNDIAEG